MALRTILILSWHLTKIVNNEIGRQFSTFSLASALKTGITLVLIHDIGTVEPRLSGLRLSGLFDYPDFFSSPVFFYEC